MEKRQRGFLLLIDIFRIRFTEIVRNQTPCISDDSVNRVWWENKRMGGEWGFSWRQVGIMLQLNNRIFFFFMLKVLEDKLSYKNDKIIWF